MKIRSRTTAGIAVGLSLALGLVVAPVDASPPPSTSVPSAAAWLAAQVAPDGSVESFGSPDAGATRQVALGLASARRGDASFVRAMTWLEANVETAIGTPDSPGALGELLLLSAAAGDEPTDFGGVDLVARLGATLGLLEPGLYGAGDATFDGAFRQALALLGLAAHGISPPPAAVDWLVDQQCGAADVGATGGWMAYRADLSEPCTAPDPVFFTGPDTNSTAVAVEALAAVDVAPDDDPIPFLAAAQGADGGFPFVPGGDVDPNSTALVIQALVAAGEDIHSASWKTAGGDPMSSLVGWQLTTGPDAGALASPYSGGFADLYATRQAIWGLAEAPFPLLATPGQVPNVAVDARATTVIVTWDTPVFNGGADITGYRVEAAEVLSPQGTDSQPQGAPVLVGPDARRVTLVEPYGTMLTVRVQAVNAEGEGLSFFSDAVTLGFSDVPFGHPFLDEIAWGSDGGVFGGFSDRTFRPTTNLSRQALAAFLYRLAGSPDGNDPTCTEAPFTDVPSDHPFCGEIDWLASEGLSTGYGDGTFRPTQPVSRLAAGVLLYRAAGSIDGDDPTCAVAPFTDVAVDSPFCGELAWMAATEVSTGFADGTYRPATNVSRQAMAAFLQRFSELD